MIEESQNIEHKESWRDEYLKWICGFANAQGGRVYIGVDDDRNVVGVEDSKRLLEDIPNKVRDVLKGDKGQYLSPYIIEREEDADDIIVNDRIPKLFLEKSSMYRSASMNWGASKGIDSFVDVCVVLNKTTQGLLEKGRLNELNPKTKNKLYVACTRAHRHLYIMSYKFLEKYKKA